MAGLGCELDRTYNYLSDTPLGLAVRTAPEKIIERERLTLKAAGIFQSGAQM